MRRLRRQIVKYNWCAHTGIIEGESSIRHRYIKCVHHRNRTTAGGNGKIYDIGTALCKRKDRVRNRIIVEKSYKRWYGCIARVSTHGPVVGVNDGG